MALLYGIALVYLEGLTLQGMGLGISMAGAWLEFVIDVRKLNAS
jgi:hypothetical protein